MAPVIVIRSSPALICSIFGVTMSRETRLLLAHLPSVVLVVRVVGRHAWCLSPLFSFSEKSTVWGFGAVEHNFRG